MKQFGGVRLIARRIVDMPTHDLLNEDVQVIRHIPSNAEATLPRARREAQAWLRSGDINARVWKPVKQVYIFKGKVKEASGIWGARYYCLTDGMYEFFGRQIQAQLVEVHPVQEEVVSGREHQKADTETGPESGGQSGGKSGRSTRGSRGRRQHKPVQRKR